MERGSALHDPDRDCIYCAVVRRRLRAIGIRDKPIALGSPGVNVWTYIIVLARHICARFLNPTLATIMRRGRTWPCIKMRPFRAL